MCATNIGDFAMAEYKCPKIDAKVHDLLAVAGKSEMDRSKKISYIDIVQKHKQNIPPPNFYSVNEIHTTRKSHVLAPLYQTPK